MPLINPLKSQKKRKKKVKIRFIVKRRDTMNQTLNGNEVIVKKEKNERDVNKERMNKEKKLKFEKIKANRRRERIVKDKQKMKGAHFSMNIQ